MFLVYPDSLRPAFPRLKDKLEDSDPSVQVPWRSIFIICFILPFKQIVLRRERRVRARPKESQELPLSCPDIF
jgi:hypothetical protein